MRVGKYLLKRLAISVPQLILVTAVTFVLIRLLPGNPAYKLAGLYATKQNVRAIDERLGLTKPVMVQYWDYVKSLLHGNLGTSWYTGHTVMSEFLKFGPATFELITISAIIIVVLGVALGAASAVRPRGWIEKVLRLYGGFSGAFPDFWLGLVLLFVFYFILRWVPAPSGQLSLGVSPPPHITGMYLVDAVLTGEWSTAGSALGHLILPVATLVIAYMGAIVKLSRATMTEALTSEACRHARACGLSERQVTIYALRTSLPSILTLVAITYTFLLAGDVLVEDVFSWGGLGSFLISSVQNSDYFPIQAFVLVAALFNLVVYLLIDVLHLWIDPRVVY